MEREQSASIQKHEVVIPDGQTDPEDGEREQAEGQATSQAKDHVKLIKKKMSLLSLAKAGRIQADLQAVEKARLLQSMGLDRQAVESIERSIKGRRPENKVYSINKQGISKTVRVFGQKPVSRPMSICFNFPGMALTHLHILKLIRGLISPYPDAKVSGIQFVDRNVLHGSRGLDNRWIITLTSPEARDYAINSGLPLFNKVVRIRSYDDTVAEEYEAFLRYTKLQKYLNPETTKTTDNGCP